MQARSQKSVMGGGVAGSGGGSPNHRRQLWSGGKTPSHRRRMVWGSDPPALEKKLLFLAKLLNFRPIFIKIMPIIRGIEISSAKNDYTVLVA